MRIRTKDTLCTAVEAVPITPAPMRFEGRPKEFPVRTKTGISSNGQYLVDGGRQRRVRKSRKSGGGVHGAFTAARRTQRICPLSRVGRPPPYFGGRPLARVGRRPRRSVHVVALRILRVHREPGGRDLRE